MDNLEWLEKMKDDDNTVDEEKRIYYRKAKALEIIAEQIINLDNTLACVVSALENIETAIKQR